MSLIGIELSDAGIHVAGRTDGVASLLEVDCGQTVSPGYALIQKRKIISGVEAAQQSRLYPRQVSNQFWERLSIEPVGDAASDRFTYADLAFAHMERIWKNLGAPSSEVVIAVPGYYDKTHMGLVLGIAQELNMPVRKLIDTALMASLASANMGETVLHLDVHMHMVTVTVMRGEESLVRRQVKTLQGMGWSSLYGHLIKEVSRMFVQSTRFDPLHSAATEQLLFNQLERLTHNINRKSFGVIELSSGGQDYKVPLSADVMDQATSKMVDGIEGLLLKVIEESNADRVLVADRAARVPGLYRKLKDTLELPVSRLKEGMAARNILDHAAYFYDERAGKGIGFMTSLPIDPNTETESLTAIMPTTKPAPSHLLVKTNAHDLSQAPFFIGWDGTSAVVGDLDPDDRRALIRMTAEGCMVEPIGESILIDGSPITRPTLVIQGNRIGLAGTDAEFVAISAYV